MRACVRACCSIAAPHLDPLVIKAIKFLTAAVAKAQHAAVFGDPATLRAIAEKVVVPNLVLRDAGACARARACGRACGRVGVGRWQPPRACRAVRLHPQRADGGALVAAHANAPACLAHSPPAPRIAARR